MKKGKIGLVLATLLVALIIPACGNMKKTEEKDAVKNYCEEYASEYEVVGTGENGNLTVSVKAPDFRAITEMLIQEQKVEHASEITEREIKKIVKDHPEYEMEYRFSVTAEDEKEIKKEFLNMVSEGMMVEGMKKIECTDEWGVE